MPVEFLKMAEIPYGKKEKLIICIFKNQYYIFMHKMQLCIF